MLLALAGEITKINCAANVMEWIVHIYYRTMKFSKGNFSTALHIQDHARTVHCPVTTLLKILQVGQIEAPHIWRFLSQANLLLCLSLRIYSLCHTLSAPSPQHRMWHYLFFMILAGTQKSQREMRAAVQEWERARCKFPTCIRIHFICLLLQCLVSPKGDFFSLPSPPDGNWFNCLLNHLLQEPLSFLWLYSAPRAVNPWLEIPKGNPTNYC